MTLHVVELFLMCERRIRGGRRREGEEERRRGEAGDDMATWSFAASFSLRFASAIALFSSTKDSACVFVRVCVCVDEYLFGFSVLLFLMSVGYWFDGWDEERFH